MKVLGKLLVLVVGSFFIGIFVTFGLQLLGDLITWGYEETTRRFALFLIVGLVSWYISYLFSFYSDNKGLSKKPKNILNFWKDI